MIRRGEAPTGEPSVLPYRFRELRNLVAAAMALSCAGCATVTVSSGGDKVVVSGMFGARIKTLGMAPVAIRSQGLGVSQSAHAFSAGWYSEVGVYAPAAMDGCRVVLISNTEQEVRRLVDVLHAGGTDVSQICINQQGVSR
jgi:hypothetical protein